MLRDNIIMLRNVKRYSQEEVAEKIGVSRQAYAKWEKGESVPDVMRCQKLAELYGTSIDSLLNFSYKVGNEPVMPGPKGKHIFGTVKINERGQIVIPKKAREIFDIKKDDELVVLGDETEGLALIKAELFERRMNDMWSKRHNIIEE